MPSSAWKKKVCSSDRKSTRLNSSHTLISYAVFYFVHMILQRLHQIAQPLLVRVRALDHQVVPAGYGVLLGGLSELGRFDEELTGLFFFNDPATTEIYPLSLHDALPISGVVPALSPTKRRLRFVSSATAS